MKKHKVGNHKNVIDSIAAGMRDFDYNQRYLEIGVAEGGNFNRVAPLFKEAYAVDVNKSTYALIKNNKNLNWNNCTSRIFLNKIDKDFDMIFIDGDHHHEVSYEDFEGCYRILKDNGIIIMHDTHPPTEKHLSQEKCGDTYKTPIKIKENYKDIEIVTLPIYYGLTIIRKTTKQVEWMDGWIK